MIPPDLAGIAAPEDPDDYRERPILGIAFWSMIALCLVCVLAGAAIGLVLPRLLAERPQTSPAAEAAPALGERAESR